MIAVTSPLAGGPPEAIAIPMDSGMLIRRTTMEGPKLALHARPLRASCSLAGLMK
jgi:hypothetical protein